MLARALAGGSNASPSIGSRQALPVAGLVRKTVATKHQKGLGKAGRQSNLRGVFTVDKRAVAGLSSGYRALLLVDDVYTTGATAREVSSVLVAGIRLPVHVFTFSRVVAGVAEGHD